MMKPTNLKGIMLMVLVCVGGLAVLYLVLKPQLISVQKIGNDQTVNAVFVGPEKYQSGFADSLKSAEASAEPFRRAGDLMKVGQYEAVLEALNESLEKSQRRIEKLMVYDRMRKVYQAMGDKEKELWALEKEIEETREGPGRDELRERATEIRRLLADKDNQKVKMGSPMKG